MGGAGRGCRRGMKRMGGAGRGWGGGGGKEGGGWVEG